MIFSTVFALMFTAEEFRDIPSGAAQQKVHPKSKQLCKRLWLSGGNIMPIFKKQSAPLGEQKRHQICKPGMCYRKISRKKYNYATVQTHN